MNAKYLMLVAIMLRSDTIYLKQSGRVLILPVFVKMFNNIIIAINIICKLWQHLILHRKTRSIMTRLLIMMKFLMNHRESIPMDINTHGQL